MKNASTILSGLDIQRDYLSIAQYSQEEKAVQLVAIQPVSLINGGDLGEQLTGELKELKSKFKFSSPDIICSIPSEYAVIKHLTIDKNDENPQDSLEWEMSQQVLGSLDEYVYDFQEINSGSEKIKNYLSVAYRKSNINSISSTLKSVRLNPVVIDLDIFALINVIEANYPEKLDNPSVIIHSETTKTKIILSIAGTFSDYEYFDFGNASPEPEEFADKCKTELEKIITLNQNTFDKNPINIFYTGSLLGQYPYSNALVSSLGSGELINPFRRIGCRVGVDQDQLNSYISQLAVAVGLAYRGND